MSNERREFPALEARKSELEHQHAEARKQAADSVRAGNADHAVMQWIANIRAELDELTYVLRHFALRAEGRIAVTWVAFAVVLSIMVAITLLQLAFIFMIGR